MMYYIMLTKELAKNANEEFFTILPCKKKYCVLSFEEYRHQSVSEKATRKAILGKTCQVCRPPKVYSPLPDKYESPMEEQRMWSFSFVKYCTFQGMFGGLVASVLGIKLHVTFFVPQLAMAIYLLSNTVLLLLLSPGSKFPLQGSEEVLLGGKIKLRRLIIGFGGKCLQTSLPEAATPNKEMGSWIVREVRHCDG